MGALAIEVEDAQDRAGPPAEPNACGIIVESQRQCGAAAPDTQ